MFDYIALYVIDHSLLKFNAGNSNLESDTITWDR